MFRLIILIVASFNPAFGLFQRPSYNGTTLKAKAQSLDCYDRAYQSGASIRIEKVPAPDLGASPYFFDNRAVSCRFNGIYFLYEDKFYNKDREV